MGQTKKKDNDFLRDKLALRVNHLPCCDVSVLDCYSGKGVIWRGVKKITGRKIKTLPIDIRDDLTTFHLDGKNEEFLAMIDLKKFNVIDLDAYGIPYIQLKILFDRKYSGIVFVTFIQSIYGNMPNGILKDVGFTKDQIEKCPTLFGKRGWDFFLEWLAACGVKKINHRSHNRKHYLCFTI